jgi:microcystin-dependent protein
MRSIYFENGGHRHDGEDKDGHCAKIESGEFADSVINLIKETTRIAAGVFIGEIRAYAGNLDRPSDMPLGYALCDGGSVNSDDYKNWVDNAGRKDLINGAAYITPDLRGRVLIGAGEGFTLGDAGGESRHVLKTEELPEHDHVGDEIGGCTYDRLTMFACDVPTLGGVKRTTNGVDSTTDGGGEYQISVCRGDGGVTSAGTSGTVAEHREAARIKKVGENAAHNNMQPYAVINYIIRVEY